MGVNNFTNELPDSGLANAPAAWLGRFFYAGFRVNTDRLGFSGVGSRGTCDSGAGAGKRLS